jgi:hypothetical protein
VKLGDTFLITDPGASLDIHLWIVISDPGLCESVVIANVTSWSEHKEQACVLSPDDHSWLIKKSCMNYRDARVVSIDQLNCLLSRGLIEMRDCASNELLRKVLRGVSESTQMPMQMAGIIADQGLLDEFT